MSITHGRSTHIALETTGYPADTPGTIVDNKMAATQKQWFGASANITGATSGAMTISASGLVTISSPSGVIIPGVALDDITLGAGHSIWYTSGTGAFDASNGSGVTKTTTGANTLSGMVTISAGRSLDLASGSGYVNCGLGTGVFHTTSGINYLNGMVSVTANRSIDMVAGTGYVNCGLGTGVFHTTSGANYLNGMVSVTAGRAITLSAGTGYIDASLGTGIFKTTTGENTIGGTLNIAGGRSIILAAGTGAADFSLGSGETKTTTGANTLSGMVTISAGRSLTLASGSGACDLSGGSGIFKSTTGENTLSGMVTIAAGRSLTMASGSGVADFSGAASVILPNTGVSGLASYLSVTGTAGGSCTAGLAINAALVTAGVDSTTAAGIVITGGATSASITYCYMGSVTATADSPIGANKEIKTYSGGRLGELLNYTNAGTTIAATAGGNFANQPSYDSISITSDSAADVQTATLYGTTATGTTVVVENIVLTGTTPKSTVKADWGELLGVELSSAATGTITFAETSASGTITTITAGNTTKGLTNITNTTTNRAFNRKPMIIADGSSTKKVGLVGTGTDYSAITNLCSALNNTTAVEMGTACNTVTKLLFGDVASSTVVTVKTNTTEDNRILKVGRCMPNSSATGKDGSFIAYVSI